MKEIVGKNIDENTIEEIKRKDSYNKGMNIALNYLGYGMKTEKEIVDKLKSKEIEEDYISLVIEKLKSYKYIDDELYTKTYIKTKAIPKGWGLQKIISTLYSKGIDKNMIEKIYIPLISYEENNDNIKEIALKKWKSFPENMEIRKRKEKLTRFLLSKGHNWEKINEVFAYIEKNSE